MTKLNVNEIEANGTNNNVKVVGKGADGVAKLKVVLMTQLCN